MERGLNIAAVAVLMLASVSANAIPLVNLGQNTLVPSTRLLWLDLNLSQGTAYGDMNALIGQGGSYEGYWSCYEDRG